MASALHQIVIRVVLLLTTMAAGVESRAQEKAPIPDAQAQARGKKAAQDIYGDKFGQAKTAAQKSGLAKDMLETASTIGDGSADQYALLTIARDVAAGAGDVATALAAVEKLGQRFDVPAAKLKGQSLLTAAGKASTSVPQKAIAEAALKVLDELAAADEYELALSVCEAARTCARAARQNSLVKDLNARTEQLKQREAALQEYRKAMAVLESRPTDADANLAAGKYLCLVKGDWSRGISLLALGGDAELRGAAEAELKGANSVDEQAALGDRWWDLARTREGREKEALRVRAGFWYQQAKPQLAAGLVLVKVNKRLAELTLLREEIPDPPAKPVPGPALAIASFDEKQAKGLQLQWSRHLKVPVVQTNSIGMKLVLIPPGEFDMGSTPEEVARLLEEGKRQNAPGWYLDLVLAECARHRVKISKPFYLGVCEVTQAEYGRVLGQDPSKFKGDPNRPVEQVNWNDAVEFCQRLSASPKEKAAGALYRLPTEAEWEFACRAGTMTRYSFGDAATGLTQHAWWKDNSQDQTHPVGQLRPNAWGLSDMHGNVWEWCQDWLGDRYYATSPPDDPTGASGGSDRVSRGGGWYFDASFCRAACRRGFTPDYRYGCLGFRVACSLPGK